MKEGTKEQTNE